MKLSNLFVVGLAFATIGASSFAHGGHGGGPGHSHGGHGHGGHGGHGGKITCAVKNLRGDLFTARGKAFRRFEVMERAMNKCERAGSRVCRPLGCGF